VHDLCGPIGTDGWGHPLDWSIDEDNNHFAQFPEKTQFPENKNKSASSSFNNDPECVHFVATANSNTASHNIMQGVTGTL
jgi:hypothetical protein